MAIKEVRQGDLVLAQHKETGEVACREVESRSANPNQAIILVTLESADGTTEVIETTENHPFYVEGRGWTRVDELVPGDLVPSATNGILVVSALEWTDRAEIVYNFGVDEFHTYFVGEVGAWVHNCWRGKINIGSGDSKSGWTHIEQRHISGTHPDGPGDLFSSRTTKRELEKVAQKIVDKGVRLSDPQRIIQVFEKRMKVGGKLTVFGSSLTREMGP